MVNTIHFERSVSNVLVAFHWQKLPSELREQKAKISNFPSASDLIHIFQAALSRESDGGSKSFAYADEVRGYPPKRPFNRKTYLSTHENSYLPSYKYRVVC